MTERADATDQTWPTAITDIGPDRILIRGYPIEELMGRLSFCDAICLIFLGELPDARTSHIVEAILVASLDHGPASPSANTSRLAASTGAEPGHAAAAGLLAINTYHGAAIAAAMDILEAVVAQSRICGDLVAATAETVASWRQQGGRIPGFGHRVHPTDHRVARLFEIAGEHQAVGPYVDAARQIEAALNVDAPKPIPMNLDGAIAAVLCEMGWPVVLANSLFMVSRFVGLNAQAAEETTRMHPMRRIRADQSRYDGPAVRHLPLRQRH